MKYERHRRLAPVADLCVRSANANFNTTNTGTTMQWEYMTLVFAATGFILGGKLDGKRLNDRLNELGEEGWELVSVFDTNMLEGKTRDVYAILKRPWIQNRK